MRWRRPVPSRYIIDLRGATRGDLDDGLAAARLFVKMGTLAIRETKGNKETVAGAARRWRDRRARGAARRSEHRACG